MGDAQNVQSLEGELGRDPSAFEPFLTSGCRLALISDMDDIQGEVRAAIQEANKEEKSRRDR